LKRQTSMKHTCVWAAMGAMLTAGAFIWAQSARAADKKRNSTVIFGDKDSALTRLEYDRGQSGSDQS
jgi:hypothetical protein